MNTKMIESRGGSESTWAEPVLWVDHTIAADPQPARRSLWADPQALKSMEDAMESLVATYLDANLNFRNLPLKEFLDGIEKQILLTGLRLTGGHQRNTARLLGLKPTALFEKLRKHCINCRQHKLLAKLAAPPLERSAG